MYHIINSHRPSNPQSTPLCPSLLAREPPAHPHLDLKNPCATAVIYPHDSASRSIPDQAHAQHLEGADLHMPQTKGANTPLFIASEKKGT